MTRAFVDFDPPQPDAPDFESETSDLVYFLSWAFATRYGANHELSLAALVLRGEFKIDLTPLLTFADRDIEDEADSDELERVWQEPEPLAETCKQVMEALASGDEGLTALQEEYPSLRRNIEELGLIGAWAASRHVRVRLTYELADLEEKL